KLKQAEKTKTNNENKYIKDEEINDDIRYILQKFLILFKCTNVIPKIDQLINIDSTEGVRDFMLRGPILHHLDVYDENKATDSDKLTFTPDGIAYFTNVNDRFYTNAINHPDRNAEFYFNSNYYYNECFVDIPRVINAINNGSYNSLFDLRDMFKYHSISKLDLENNNYHNYFPYLGKLYEIAEDKQFL